MNSKIGTNDEYFFFLLPDLLRFVAFRLVALGSLGGTPQTNMQLAQLLFIHFARRLGHEAGGALGFRECDHVTDRRGAGHQHDQAVEPEGEATVGRANGA